MCWNEVYHATEKRVAQSYTKSLTHIKIATEDKSFKNQTTDETLKQIYLSEVMRNLQHSFSMDQLEKLGEVRSNKMGKYI